MCIRILFADLADSSVKSAVTSSKSSADGVAQKTTHASQPTTATATPPGSTADSAKGSSGRNLWVSGLSSTTRATDLKQLFSKYGKVVGAKVVTNTKMAGSRCYGYVTMNAAEDALKCVEHLHRTELHGRMISVEKAKSELSAPKSGGSVNGSSSTATPATAPGKPAASQPTKTSGESQKKPYTSAKNNKEAPRTSRAERPRSTSRRLNESGRDSGRTKEPDNRRSDRRSPVRALKSATQDEAGKLIAAKERELQRERERDRLARERERVQFEADRLRHEREKARLKEKLLEEEKRTREVRRKAREEEERLARERKKIQLERARLERERAELVRLERQKLEREKLELERQEIKRQQMKYDRPAGIH